MRKKKYKPGRRIATIGGLDAALKAGKYVYICGNTRPQHPGWVQSMQFRYLSNLVYLGDIRVAVRNK